MTQSERESHGAKRGPAPAMTRDSVGMPVPHGAPQWEIRPGWMQKRASELCWVRAAAMLVAAARAALLILLQQQVSSKAALGMLSQGMGGPFPTLHKSNSQRGFCVFLAAFSVSQDFAKLGAEQPIWKETALNNP